MNELISKVLNQNSSYKEALEKEVSFSTDIEGKGILNKQVDKLFKSKSKIKNEKHFQE